MSEATATATPAPTDPTKIPTEVQDEINKEFAAIHKMAKPALLEKLDTEYGIKMADPDSVNEKWLIRKLQTSGRAKILASHNLSESPIIKKNREKVDAEDPSTPSVGRKRMTTAGSWKLELGTGGKEGRLNSTKGKVVAAMKEKGIFTYEDFKAAVSEAYQWDEASKGFNGITRFSTLDQAANAWWSELKNKAKIIVEATPTA